MQTGQKFKRLVSAWGPPMLIVFGGLWLLQAALAHTSGHGVIIRDADYNAGVVHRGILVRHSVHLVNLSSQAVRVIALPSCGCTVVDAPSRILAPMHSASVSADIDTTGMRSGPYQKFVRLNLESADGRWQQAVSIKFQLR